ncbi:MAG: F0F1 ATP synthase subunit B [Cytophagales bacterium]|nr:MAG: F0F1 ATP synthase subunit B [Cytophagales bacterium]
MDLVTPGFGLIFWQTVVFLTIVLILSRVAWKPITQALKDRENSIADALASAEKARQEMQNLTASNEKLLDEARSERDKVLKDAYQVAETIRQEAKEKTAAEVNRMLDEARNAIQMAQQNAVADMKKQISIMSIEIAEKIIRTQLDNPQKQKELVESLVKDISLG